MSNRNTLYDQDFYAWSSQQALLLRTGNLDQIDVENIAEEIESMGRSEKRELVSRLTILLLHMLKWQFQSLLRGPSWRATIRIQRRDLLAHIQDNPSLKSVMAEAITQAYGNAVIEAEAETGLAESTFPQTCPWSMEQIMQADYWPG